MRKLEDHPWWDELVQLKDQLSLRELSDRFGVAPSAISNALQRNALLRDHAPSGPRLRFQASETGETPQTSISLGDVDTILGSFADLLGEVPDEEIAAISGVSTVAVALYRISRGINKAVPISGVGAPEPTLQSADVAAVRRWRARCKAKLFGYQVRVGSRRLLVVAPDLLAAASIARSSGVGPIERIDLLAAVL